MSKVILFPVFLRKSLHRWATEIFFKKSKHNQTHSINSRYAVGSGSFSFSYEGNYYKTFDHWDTYLRVEAEVPRSVANFHGLGNETIRNIDELGRDFYRIRRTLLGVYPAFIKRGDGGSTLSVGPAIESIKISDLSESIISRENTEINSAVFNKQLFSGGHLNYNYLNVDHLAIPTRGIGLQLGGKWRANLTDLDRQHLKLDGELKFHLRLGVSDRFVLSNRIGGQHIIGDFDFFQATTLGGDDKLRGFAQQRFAGRTAFYHNIDLRIKIIDSENQTIPISGGITPGLDYGRVWVDNDASSKLHVGYGGSIWLAPIDFIALQAGIFFSEEGSRFTVRAGFQF